MTAQPSAPRLILDETGGTPAGKPRDLEQELRAFHLHSRPGTAGGGAGYLPAVLWEAASSPGTGDEDPEITVLRIFLEQAEGPARERREKFRESVDRLARQLTDLLKVDDNKRASRTPDRLAKSMGGVGDLLDTRALATGLGDWRGAALLSPERRKRLEDCAEELRSFPWDELPRGVVVRATAAAAPLPPEAEGWLEETVEEPCSAAPRIFDEFAERLSALFAAVRIGQLEAAGRFDPERHGPWIDHLEPGSFSRTERDVVPVVVALDSAERVVANEIPGFTRFLLSDRPVHLLLRADRAPDLGEGERLQLGYLAMAHRKAFVQQSSLGSPEHLAAGMALSFQHMQPALHVILEDRKAFAAALQSRVHPVFRYDPQAGSSWARRMDFSGNPDPEEDWPQATVEFDRVEGLPGKMTLAVTPADWALLQGDAAADFRPVPPGYASDHLTELGSYLSLGPQEAMEHLPYVWAADTSGHLQRLVVTRRIVLACREQQDFWHTLQEISGVRSDYVTEAVRRTREDLESRAESERRQSAETHAAEVAKARERAVSEAVHNLSRRLMDPDFAMPSDTAPEAAPDADPAAAPSPATTAASATAPAAPDECPAATAPVNGDTPVSATPWIDSAACTSCNDCIGINSVVFVYDANKQATIGNPRGGTYAQIVRAAEKCPARCIHPGMPLNPGEPGLEKLIQRAQAYQ